ncbi:SDR family oxidoreductase [Rhabdobacter roseus]
MASRGIDPHHLSFTPSPQGEHVEAFFESESLVVDIPPRLSKQGEEFHPQQLEHIVRLVEKSPIKNIIYLSSTSVYPALNRLVTEEDVRQPDESASPALVKAEQQMASLRADRHVTILRCGGLMGYDRIPGKYVKGQKNLTTGSVPVNYVHRDDVIALIARILEDNEVTDSTFNVVAPFHPTRREVYEASCAQFGWESPTFLPTAPNESFKIVVGDKVCSSYDFSFRFPNPLHFYYTQAQSVTEPKA